MTPLPTRPALAAMLALLAAGGCASQPPVRPVEAGVGMRMVTLGEQPGLDLASDQVFQMPIALHEPLPGYPPELIRSDAPPQSVCVELELDELGVVRVARPLYQRPECPAAADALPAAMVQSTLAAVRTWRFIPAEVCHFPPGVEPNRDCIGAGVELTPVPIRLAFAFAFAIEGGTASVLKRATGPATP